MIPVVNSTSLIGACGLYCGACRKFLKDQCPGCRHLDSMHPVKHRRQARWLERCKIRRCCKTKAFHTCAECSAGVEACKTYTNLVSKLFGLLFNSDRSACIRYIRQNGEEAFAEKMTWYELMTMPRRK